MMRSQVSVHRTDANLGHHLYHLHRHTVWSSAWEICLRRGLRWALCGRIAHRTAAVRAEAVVASNQALALQAIHTQPATALRAEGETSLNRVSTLRAAAVQWLPEDEVKKNAQGVRNHNGDDCPERRAHAAAFGVAIDIADDQQVTGASNTGQ